MNFKPTSPILMGLQKYKDENLLRFHMPGHYGRDSFDELKYLAENLYDFDVTEVDGTDNLNVPKEMIKETLDKISKVYNSKKSYISVNGSTTGIKVAIDTLVPDKGLVITARNCHKSVYNILTRKNCNIEYIYPQIDEEFGIDSHIQTDELISLVAQIESVQSKATSPQKISAVVLTYPNYFGRTYDLQSIAKYLKSKNIFLIVDEAHGAHFVYSDLLPKSAIELGADICIQSTHKTMPSLTQTALIHLGKDFDDRLIPEFENNLISYQTTSPSYIFMASIEASIEIMLREVATLNELYYWIYDCADKIGLIPEVAVYTSQDFCKLGVNTPYSGEILSKHLREKYKIQAEMSIGNNILFMIGLTHTKKDLEYLAESIKNSLNEIQYIYKEEKNSKEKIIPKNILPKPEKISASELSNMKISSDYSVELKPINETLSLVCSDIITPYPPGIPILVPGDIISQDIILLLEYLQFSEIKCFILK